LSFVSWTSISINLAPILIASSIDEIVFSGAVPEEPLSADTSSSFLRANYFNGNISIYYICYSLNIVVYYFLNYKFFLKTIVLK